MPTFGAYETVTEISRGAICTLWTGRRAAGAAAGTEDQVGAAVFAIKVCQPDVDITGVEGAQASVQAFLEQVDAQRRLAGLPDSVWAPIHDSGRADASGVGAFYVTNYYARTSLERFVTSRARLDPKVLQAVIAGALGGIRQIRDFLRRPHGNLHAGNVLLLTDSAGGGGGGGARIVLTDPAGQSQLKGRTDVAGDLHALGAILYQLVTHQEYHERSGWPLADSADWKRVPGGERWRALCNRLLDPNPGSPPTVEEIEQTLLNISPKGGKRVNKLILIGGGVAVAAAVGIYFATRPPPAPPTPPPVPPSEQWVALVGEYQDWFAAFADVSRQGTKTKALEDRVPEFKEWLGALRSLPKDDPWEIAGVAKSLYSLDQLKKEAPASIEKPEAAQAATDLLGVIKTIKTGISKGDWSLAKEAATVTAAWRAQGWEAASEEIDKALGAVKADRSMIHTATTLAGLLDKAKQIEAARASAGSVVKRVTDGSKKVGGDKVLDAFKTWADAYPGRSAAAAEKGAVLEALAAGVEKVRTTATGVATFLESPAGANVCFDELAKSTLYTKFTPTEARPEDFEDWAAEAKLVRYANPAASEDPRAGKDLVEPASKLSAELERLKKNSLEPSKDSLIALETLATELGGSAISASADTAGKLTAIQARTAAIKQLKWDCRTREEIGRVRYDAALKQIDEVSRAWGKQNRDAEVDHLKALADLEALDSPVRDSAAIKAWWTAQRAVVFREPDARVRRDKATDLQERLVALDAGVPQWEAPPPAAGTPAGRQPEWVKNVSRVAQDHRDKMIGEFLAKRDAATAWTEADQRALADGFKGWTASLDKAAAAATSAERLMNSGYGLDEAAPGGKTVGALADEAFGTASPATEAMAPVASRVTALRDVAKATDPAQLARLITPDAGVHPELVLAAWQGLGKGGAWPASPADLDKEAGEFGTAIRGALRTIQETEGSTTRRDELAAAIGEQRRARWESFVKRVGTEAEMDRAMAPDPIHAMEVDVTKATDPLVRYRIGTYQVKRAVSAPGVTDEQVKAAVDQFVQSVPGDLAGDARVAAFLTEMRKAVSGEDAGPPKVDPKKLGPGALAGWTAEEAEAPGGRQLMRFTNGQLSLKFLRVEAGTGVQDPVFIGMDEVTLGEFIQIIEGMGGANGWRTLQPLMLAAENDEQGPRAWKWTRGKLALFGEWLQENRPAVGMGAGQAPAYAGPLLRQGDGKQISVGQAPSLNSPMQYVAPGAAVYAAGLVGCRFPTAAEWALAVKAGPAAEGAPNLRDQTWKAQFDYIAATRGRMDAVKDQFPFPDTDVFNGAKAPEQEAATAGSGNDGWLWFQPAVEGATGFAHLTGNVAEYVMSGAPEGPASADAGGVSTFLSRRGRDLAVIGGSALSPPQAPSDQPLPVSDTENLWSDVGFRLAFSATGTTPPKRSKAEVVVAILANPATDPFLLK